MAIAGRQIDEDAAVQICRGFSAMALCGRGALWPRHREVVETPNSICVCVGGANRGHDAPEVFAVMSTSELVPLNRPVRNARGRREVKKTIPPSPGATYPASSALEDLIRTLIRMELRSFQPVPDYLERSVLRDSIRTLIHVELHALGVAAANRAGPCAKAKESEMP